MPHEPAEPTQRTPKGLAIPVPSREEFLRNMEKVAPVPRDDDEREPEHDGK